MTRQSCKYAITLGLMIFGVGLASAFAGSVLFNYNSLATGSNNAAVQNYMNGLLAPGQSVIVTGSKSADNYTGDGHVVGPCNSGCKSVTLDSAGGNFIINAGGAADTITMNFSGIKYNYVKFDLEIFPDGTCANGSSGVCGTGNTNWPDFEFYENGNLVHTWLGKMPGDTTHGGSVWTHSPASGSGSKELAPQLIVYNVAFAFQGPITSLSFKDWPATIGVDNLHLSIPEPSSLMLLGVGMLGLLGAARRKWQA